VLGQRFFISMKAGIMPVTRRTMFWAYVYGSLACLFFFMSGFIILQSLSQRSSFILGMIVTLFWSIFFAVASLNERRIFNNTPQHIAHHRADYPMWDSTQERLRNTLDSDPEQDKLKDQ
jgi:surface polysaccharide O-acyltransferase-like enzyme